MANFTEYIVLPCEIEVYVQSLEISVLENIGTKSWLEFHKKLTLLNQQSVVEITGLREESVMEWFISLKKIPILIYEAVQIDIWKHKVFPLLIDLNGEPPNTFMLFSVIYHEVIVVSLLENILFHCESAQTLDDTIIDLIDYAIQYVTMLLDGKSYEIYESSQMKNSNSCLEEILEKQRIFEFDIGMRCISILHYLIEFLDNLPLCAVSRMLVTHDVPYLFIQLIENQPWRRQSAGETQVYDANWKTITADETGKVCKREGQVWFGLRELLLNPKASPYYEITQHRLSQLSKLQRYLHEDMLDQIAPLVELKRWLSYLSMSSATSSFTSSETNVRVEVVPQIKSSILEKYHKKWSKLVRHQSKFLFTTDTSYIKDAAQILSESYDLEKINRLETKKCSLCQEFSEKRCSKCKKVWYCSRQCQVKDWENHKNICNLLAKTTE